MTVKPTYEMALLTQRIVDGDVTAIEPLWSLLFDTPLDPTRTLEDIANDIAEKLQPTDVAEDDAPPQPKKSDPVADAVGALVGLVSLVDAAFAEQAKRKKSDK